MHSAETNRRVKYPPPDDRMGNVHQSLNEPPVEEGFIMLKKDDKTICRTLCINSPIRWSSNTWSISEMKRTSTYPLSGLGHFCLRPAWENEHQKREWKLFTDFLATNNKAAYVSHEACEFYIFLHENRPHTDVVVFYRLRKANCASVDNSDETIMESKHVGSQEKFAQNTEINGLVQPGLVASTSGRVGETLPLSGGVAISVMSEEIGDSFDANVKGKNLNTCSATHLAKLVSKIGDHNACNAAEGVLSQGNQDDHVEKNYVRADPSFLKTLGQTHSGWIFGAIAELVDNSSDAKASKLEVFVETLYSKREAKEIPVLSIIDDGDGMSHEEIVRMLSLGRKAPDVDDLARIGRFGIGFKTGAMRIGRDAIVLTQTSKSRSIGFLSQSLNEGQDNLEIPIVSYCRRGSNMEIDTSVHSEASADYHLKVIKEFSPFNEYLVGEKLAIFRRKGTGTQVYVWNLDEWGSSYCLDWQQAESPSCLDDIQIRSRRIRLRPGQISFQVPLDYSLRSYLEVIFLHPRMKIFVQGSMVKSHPLAKSLNNTTVINGDVMGKPVQLTLGRSQLEWEQVNCGIFLYWHGRLIEAYKRVGGMVHNADMGRGVIGVIDVTDLMNDGKHVWVHNNKQGFQDCEVYSKLEEWLGEKTDKYWDDNFDALETQSLNANYVPDHQFVQCDKCRKWRILTSGYDVSTLPREWFCCMAPFNGKCETPEQEVDQDVITVAAGRSGCVAKQKPDISEQAKPENRKRAFIGNSDSSSQTMEENKRPLQENVCQVQKNVRPVQEDVRPVRKRLRRKCGNVNLR